MCEREKERERNRQTKKDRREGEKERETKHFSSRFSEISGTNHWELIFRLENREHNKIFLILVPENENGKIMKLTLKCEKPPQRVTGYFILARHNRFSTANRSNARFKNVEHTFIIDLFLFMILYSKSV